MKASTTGTVKTSEGERTRRRTTVSLALRDKTLALTLSARLAAECDSLICPFTDPAQLEQWLEEHPADVLLLEERWLPRLAGTMPRFRERRPNQRVLLVGDRACTALAEQVVRNRFQGFLLARDAADTCAKAVRTVKRGEIWVPRALLVQLLFEHLQAAGDGSLEAASDDKLTRREVEIVGYVRRGFANKPIVEALGIREDTVKKHLRNAYTKLGVHRRTEIITSAAERFVSG